MFIATLPPRNDEQCSLTFYRPHSTRNVHCHPGMMSSVHQHSTGNTQQEMFIATQK